MHRVTCWSQCCCRAICLLQWDQSLQHFFGAIFTSILASSLWWPPFRLPFDPLLSFVAGLVSFAKQASKTWDGHSSPRGSSWVLQMHPEMLATQAQEPVKLGKGHVSEWFQNSIQESNLKFLFHEETMAHAAKWLHELIFCASINNFCQPTLWQTLENHGKSRWNEWSTMNSNHFPAGRPCGIRLPRFASASPSISISCRCALKGSRLSGFSTDDNRWRIHSINRCDRWSDSPTLSIFTFGSRCVRWQNSQFCPCRQLP